MAVQYTAKAQSGYGEFYKDDSLQYIFNDLPEAAFVAKFANEQAKRIAELEELVERQNARADEKNKLISELEARLADLRVNLSMPVEEVTE